MADAAVEFLLQKLSSLLEREASLLGGLYNEVHQIKCELESMKSFLKDSDGRNYSSESALTWVGQVRDVAYEIEDMVDEFVFRMDRPNRGEAMGVFRNIVHFFTSLIARHVIASQLQIIKSKVHQISERRLRYGVRSIEDGTSSTDASKRWKRYEGPYSSTEDENIVGIGKRQDILVKWLMEDEPDRLVISVVGIGGSGKTTLVSRVYNTPIVKGHFDCFAWISVSQSYQVDDLLRRIMKEFFKVNKEVVPEDLDTMNYGQLAEMLNCYLQEKRYVIVLDDIWSSGVWSEINDAFPDYKDGSRIIITSRNENTVPPSGTVSRVYHLQPLEENDAWSLFCKKAFWNDRDGACPREVLSWARNMVKKCEGLPLAIIAMGSLMSFREKTEVEWKKVYQNLSWELSNNPMLESVKGILFLSFRDLPYHLKHCFLYCSIFPEDFVIIQMRLIRLWIAEGFVCERRGMTLEEVADAYLQELIFRNMLQVAETNVVGGAEGCRMHDLLRELALSTSEKENFCSIYNDGKARRLSIHKSSGNNEYTTSMSHLRSFFLFPVVNIQSSSLRTILTSFRLLRVLDLEGASIDYVPNELTKLFNLRYLSFRDTDVRELPKSLGRLGTLQTLDVGATNIEKLPHGIVKLQNLRHLIMYRHHEIYKKVLHFSTDMKPLMGIWKLRNLQTLLVIKAEGEIVRQLQKMTQLRRLGIVEVRAVEGIELCSSIQKLNLLKHLHVSAKNESESLKLESLSPPPLLQKLILVGHLYQVPIWFGSLRNLAFLYLYWSRLLEDPLPSLHALPNLGCLELINAYDGQQLWFDSGWFPRLKVLCLQDLSQLNMVRIEEAALPSIQHLYLRSCGELKILPHGIEYLTGLQQLHLAKMPKDLEQSVRGDESEYHPKIRHIPNIRII